MTTPPPISNRHFIALMACLAGVTAIGIDAVLPIFPEMINYFQLPHEEHNRIQQIVYMYMLGFSLFPLLCGVLADTIGRKPVLLLGIGVAAIACFSVIFMDSFEHVLWARFIQGAGLSAPRVISMTVIRDRASGREMAQIMSFVMTIFLMIPAIAPMIGQTIILFAPWQAIFVFLTLLSVLLFIWVAKALPETLAPENRRSPSITQFFFAIREFLGNRNTLIYLYMIGMMFGALMIYIGQAEQILQKDIYKLGKFFPFAFAAIVLAQVGASIINAKMVMRVGMRRMINIALVIMVVADTVLLTYTLASDGVVPLWFFIVALEAHFFSFSLMMSNLNTMALIPYHHIAGTASALIGTIISTGGLIVAQLFSHFYDGTLYSLAFGFAATTLTITIVYQFVLPEKHH